MDTPDHKSQHSEFYDALTVNECRNVNKMYSDLNLSDRAEFTSDNDYREAQDKLAKPMLYVAAGERYLNKDTTLQQWIENDNPLSFEDVAHMFDENYDADKKRFCFSEEEGRRYKEFRNGLNNLDRVLQELEERQKNWVDIKKLTLGQLQEMLFSVLKRNGYVQVEFPRVEFSNPMVIHIAIRDALNSEDTLQRLVYEAVSNTNWKLEDGVRYDLGILNGRIREV